MSNRKLLSLILIIALVFSNFAIAVAAPIDSIVSFEQETLGEFYEGSSIARDPRVEGLKDSDLIRIIVELESKPVVDYAIERGISLQKMSIQEVGTISDKLMKEQEVVKASIDKRGIDLVYHHEFVQVLNGFSGTTTLKEARAIEDLSGVKRVTIATEYERPQPEMHTSHEIVESMKAWELGFKGEGMVIAILDTGVDPSHRDMSILTDPSKAELQQSDVETLIANNTVSEGKWHNYKVPYGYNYADNNTEILDLGPGASFHGMHVAGTAGANGDTSNGGIKGVAPEAQILAMKVFGNDPGMPSTYGDIYVRAIEDSIKLGADVINMSLGSTGAFVLPEDEDPARVAIRKATEAGIIVAVSAGNSNHIGDGFANPLAKNPDIGVVGSPSINPQTLSVASIENNKILASALRYKNGEIVYMPAGSIDPVSHFKGKQVNFAYAGLGAVEDFDGLDLTGKIALISRGEYPFVEKIMNAQNNGAIGVIIFNHAGEELINMQYPEEGTIPAIFMGNIGGVALKELAETTDNYVVFTGNQQLADNPEMGKMSSFTSWGVTPSLDFKPEITAPGGRIYSTFQNNKYGMMSGTSMAAPHVAGGSAVVLERIDKDFPQLALAERSKLAKNILMNTAKPLLDRALYNNHYKLGNYVSPRRHGAGVMNLYGATTTPAVVVSPADDNLSKVNLKEIGNVSTFTLKVENFGDTPITYNLTGTVGTDLVLNGANRLETQGVFKAGTIGDAAPWLGEFPIAFSATDNTPISQIEVPAGGTVDFKVTLDLTHAVEWSYNAPLAAIFPNGTFVEGFVQLKDAADAVPELSIPYVGFYGDWDKAPIIDDTIYNPNGSPYYGNFTSLTWLDEAADSFEFLGFDPKTGEFNEDLNVISPNNDGLADHARGLFTFLRNAKAVNINILNENGEVVRKVARDTYVRKNYYDGGDGTRFRANDSWIWDGWINNQVAPDGQYYYEVETVIDFEGATPQKVIFPVKVDNQVPTITSVEYDNYVNHLSAAASDNHMVLKYDLYDVDAEEVLLESIDGNFNINDLPSGAYSIRVRVHDYAYNIAESDTIMIGDITIPYVTLESPAVLEAYNVNNIPVVGAIQDVSNIESFSFMINEVATGIALQDTTEEGVVSFNGQLVDLEDGVHRVRVNAEDQLGNVIDFERKFFVDTTMPTITLDDSIVNAMSNGVDAEVATIDFKATITDNFPALFVKLNGNVVFSQDANYAYLENSDIKDDAITHSLVEAMDLAYGENYIVLEAMDYAGNIKEEIVTITRGASDTDVAIQLGSPTALEFFDKDIVDVKATVVDSSELGVEKIEVKLGGETKVVYQAEVPQVVEEPLVEVPVIEEIIEEPPVSKEIIEEPPVIEEILVEEPVIASLVEETTVEPTTYTIEENFTNVADGLHFATVTVTLKNGNVVEAKRKIFVDTTAPIIVIPEDTVPETVTHDVDSVHLVGAITENFPALYVKVNNTTIHQETAQWLTVTEITGINYALNKAVNLAYGENDITVTAVDHAGNVSSQAFTVVREDAPVVEPPVVGLGIDTISISRTSDVAFDRDTTIAATANQSASWDITIFNPNAEEVGSKTGEGTSISYTWAPAEFMKLNGTYKAVITATKGEEVVVEERTFTVYNYPIEIEVIEVIKQGSNVVIEAAINNISTSAKDVMLVIQVKDSLGRVVNIATAKMSGLQAGNVIELGSGFGLNTSGNYTVDVFVWTGWEDPESLASPTTTIFTME
ncbi:S8 family serine peptidase [Alkaliphilus hydrothermalis]|uniref:Lactocepin n=1 Tax=Alkaliphilus hydrothermalis TaxID=1482730 RepID=A0ABS2NQ61_9FIRM|nr:S8 family serine peptidase [Alkaliphilus hydrothermalis]MBM7615056.1 lactocepin [Alkaliphilus hydrothermalis]